MPVRHYCGLLDHLCALGYFGCGSSAFILLLCVERRRLSYVLQQAPEYSVLFLPSAQRQFNWKADTAWGSLKRPPAREGWIKWLNVGSSGRHLRRSERKIRHCKMWLITRQFGAWRQRPEPSRHCPSEYRSWVIWNCNDVSYLLKCKCQPTQLSMLTPRLLIFVWCYRRWASRT